MLAGGDVTSSDEEPLYSRGPATADSWSHRR